MSTQALMYFQKLHAGFHVFVFIWVVAIFCCSPITTKLIPDGTLTKSDKGSFSLWIYGPPHVAIAPCRKRVDKLSCRAKGFVQAKSAF